MACSMRQARSTAWLSATIGATEEVPEQLERGLFILFLRRHQQQPMFGLRQTLLRK